jgi:DNA polymerase II large subunit
MQILLMDDLEIGTLHPGFYAITNDADGIESVEENIDNYEYKHRHAEQPRQKIFTHDVLLILIGPAATRACAPCG